MDYYLCQTAEGPRLAGTQADAKALDRNFKPYAVDTAKAPLMAHLNALLAQAYQGAELTAAPGGIRINGKPATAEDVVAIGHQMDDEDGGYPAIPPAPKLRAGLPKDYRGHPDDCPGCFRSKRAAELIGHSDQLTELCDIVLSFTEPFAFDRVQEMVDAGRANIAKPPVVPAPRVRTRKLS